MMFLGVAVAALAFGWAVMDLTIFAEPRWPSFIRLGIVYVSVFSLMCLGTVAVKNDARSRAEEAGHAEYYLDPETNEREWRWLPACEKETKR